jgi:hypothetical protein
MTRTVALSLGAVLALGACSSQTAGFAPAAEPSASTAIAGTALSRIALNGSIDGFTALSSLVLTYNDENAGEAPQTQRSGLGKCHAGHEFFSPDKAGTPDSSEAIDFYEATCATVARDAVRVWTPSPAGPSGEMVVRTVKVFPPGSATASSVRNETTTYSNAAFQTYGYPIVAHGFDRETSSTLAIGAEKNIVSDSESVMLPAAGAVNDYCTDSAGYNSLGIKSLAQSYGWEGGAFSAATRTANANGSVTWQATHTGETEQAPIGAFSVATGTLNTACPITVPAYTLDGGTVRSPYRIPVSVTYASGVISNLTIVNANLASGNTLNVTTASVPPGSLNFIQGAITGPAGPVASFSVNAFGNGTLKVAKSGIEYQVVGWSVIR